MAKGSARKAPKKLKGSKFGETIVEEVRSRYTAALSHVPDPALRLLQNQVSVTVMLTGVALVDMGYDKELRV